MKAFSLLAVLLAASPVIAGPTGPVAVNGVIPGEPPAKRDVVEERTGASGCNADNVLRALRNPTRAAGASVFCSGYLQSTLTVTTVIPSTSAITKTETTATTTTTTALTTAPTTTTVTCAAAPTSPPTCGFAAYGFSTYLISQTDSTDPTTCHEYCLANPNCKSFQVQLGGASYCNLYNAATAGNVQAAPGDQYYFYDRNCPDYLPPQCTSAPAKEKRAYTGGIPTFLTTVLAPRISSACSCLITSPSAPATSTVTAYATISTTTTTTATISAVQTATRTVSTTVVVIYTAAP